MKNKNFYSKTIATKYFNFCAESHICFMIYDIENDVYSVIDEECLRHLQEDFNLTMDILMAS